MVSPVHLSNMDELLLYCVNGSVNVASLGSLEKHDHSFPPLSKIFYRGSMPQNKFVKTNPCFK